MYQQGLSDFEQSLRAITDSLGTISLPPTVGCELLSSPTQRDRDLPARNLMSFGIYLTGFVVVIAGLVYGASLMHVPMHWIVVGALVLVGVGILTGVKATRQKDSAT